MTRILNRVAPKAKPVPAEISNAFEGVASALMKDLEHLEFHRAALQERRPSVILRPAVPLPQKDISGWFGGAPRLPKDMAWPQIDGAPLCFVAQIDLATLPQNIWSGIGPRKGHLAIFVHPTNLDVRVLHVAGDLVRRDDGPSPVGSCWNRTRRPDDPAIQPCWPEWPVIAYGNVGVLPAPAGWRKGKAPNLPDPQEGEVVNLADPAHQPFDEATLAELLSGLGHALEGRLSATRKQLALSLSDETRAALLALEAELQESHDAFAATRHALAPFLASFDRDGALPLILSLGQITLRQTVYRDKTEDGIAVIDVLPAQPALGRGYLGRLYEHARHTYPAAPERLSPEARMRFERIFAFDALHESGGMAHPPQGLIHSPHGPASPNEVLLELG